MGFLLGRTVPKLRSFGQSEGESAGNAAGARDAKRTESKAE
jgi:hypothetical protein